ncbi:hypothetical protein GCM10007854_21500 [Algimonas porphyrae]|uniref:Uncharacterized protein n=1 Tax=Algimonas porphyrae TaxID=1128113 RepID=A0ABQ5V0X4_9PROT|nr:hypothetical protein GCM10007854_21500 [Algimonas porphyrae]
MIADWARLEQVQTTPDGGAHYILSYSDRTLYEYDATDTPRREGNADGNAENARDAQSVCNE